MQQRSLQVGERQPPVDREPLELVEDREAGRRDRVTAVDALEDPEVPALLVAVAVKVATAPAALVASRTWLAGTVSAGASSYKPGTAGFSYAGGTLKGTLSGPSGTDFDLYLQKLTILDM